MTTYAEREALWHGKDPVVNQFMARLFENGWVVCKVFHIEFANMAFKQYEPRRAMLEITLDSENQLYYVNGDYTSAGENVLAGFLGYLKPTMTPDEINAVADKILSKAEERIEGSYARRCLGPNSHVKEAA